jgi:hypothetical protein
MAVLAQRPSRLRSSNSIPPILLPVLKTYALGYLSSTAPRVITLILTHITYLTGRRKHLQDSPYLFPASFIQIIRGGLELQRFPTFCAALVGGSTFLQARDSPSFLT